MGAHLGDPVLEQCFEQAGTLAGRSGWTHRQFQSLVPRLLPRPPDIGPTRADG
jgi:hypothetical protein